jgi:hypothetical protein
MKLTSLVAFIAITAGAFASDHNNVDKERPLRFDDAYSIAYRSFEFQNGFRLDTFNRDRPTYNFRSELQYGIAKNRDISIGLEPFIRSDGNLLGNVLEFSYFEGVAREIGSNPAFGYRVDVGVPVSGGAGTDFRVRGILTKTVRHLDKLHLNVDHFHSSLKSPGNRQMRMGAILGYSTPLGYPRRFTQTFLAEIGGEQGLSVGSGWNTWVGLGLRKQTSPTSVLDIGFQADLARSAGELVSPFRFTLGYSVSF